MGIWNVYSATSEAVVDGAEAVGSVFKVTNKLTSVAEKYVDTLDMNATDYHNDASARLEANQEMRNMDRLKASAKASKDFVSSMRRLGYTDTEIATMGKEFNLKNVSRYVKSTQQPKQPKE